MAAANWEHTSNLTYAARYFQQQQKSDRTQTNRDREKVTIPDKVGVLGGGRMGAGIAHAFLTAGSAVVVVERDTATSEAARRRITDALAKSVERGTTAETVETLTARLDVSVDYASFASCGLVVEAVPEDFDVKIVALTAAEEAMENDAWLATNTSSLSISAMAAALKHPESFCGLHFFNPVPASTLIEIVVAETTSETLATNARGWVEALGKTPIVVKDMPGFASSRLGVALALEAIRMVEEGVASAENIDTAMVLGYKHPVGPLKTTDIVGLDVRLGVAEYLHSTLGERFAPPQILRDKVARGELGRKSGKGFFTY